MMNIKPYLLLFVFAVIVGAFLVYSFAPQSTAFDSIPFAERQSLAEAFSVAAERLERGEERLLVDEFLRTSIARQPTSGHWANEMNIVVQAAWSADAAVYARKLREIAKELKADRKYAPSPSGRGLG